MAAAQRAIEAGRRLKERELGSEASYSAFVQAIKDNLIKRVAVDSNGHTAYYVTQELGLRGKTELFDDPGLVDLVQKMKVQLAVMSPPATAKTDDPLVQTFIAWGIPAVLLLAVLALSSRTGSNNPMNQT